ncbi:hypothetical protein [Desertivirga xinjiangensis]|uniref:hypothetical protein n=1 Tax=Desertivirga xinjiangensis TaxID=539206 RepID=UPI00210ED47D|nr:hypothetical protein [Pedobacter xinjiangensis]
MRKIIGTLIVTLLLGVANESYSQEKKDTTTFGQEVKQAGKATGKAVKKAGKKTGEVGAKAAAKVKDKSLKDVKGPNGETVYIDKHQRKYYINKDARRVYLD